MTTQTLTLAEFLLARIAEDEGRAEVAGVGLGAVSAFGIEVMGYKVYTPARALAEAEAKRRIVELHSVEVLQIAAYGKTDGETVFVEPDSFEDITTRRWMCRECSNNLKDDGPCKTLRLLALPYAGHVGFKDEWRL